MPRSAATPRVAIRPYTASIQYNGSSSELVKTTPIGLNTGGNSMSFVTWAFINSSVLHIHADLLASTMGRRFALGSSGGTQFFFSDGVNGANNLTLTETQFQAIGLNRFVRLVWSLTSSDVSLYSNGVLIKTQALGITMNSGAYTKLTLGRNGIGAQPLSGNQNDAYFTNSAMSLAEVQADYFNAIYPANLASAWIMNEGAGTAITDRVGLNNLTASNITWSTQVPTKARTVATARTAATTRALAV